MEEEVKNQGEQIEQEEEVEIEDQDEMPEEVSEGLPQNGKRLYE